jgi:hypothetical protein
MYPESDRELAAKFAASVERKFVRAGDFTAKLNRLVDRPLMCVVAWATEDSENEQDDLIAELAWNLAGVYFSRD